LGSIAGDNFEGKAESEMRPAMSANDPKTDMQPSIGITDGVAAGHAYGWFATLVSLVRGYEAPIMDAIIGSPW